jgi:hypothetical protein
MEWTQAPRTLWKGRSQRRGASDRVPPVLSAFRAEVEVRSASRARHRLRVGLRKTPGATRGQTVETPTVVVPFSIAHVAVVRVELSDQQIAPPAAHRTIRRADERQIAGDPVVGRNFAGDRRRSIVLPSMAGRAPMRVFGARRQVQRRDWLRAHDTARVRCRRAGGLRAPPRRLGRAPLPAETPPAHRPSGRA